jgi:hypothetical protein
MFARGSKQGVALPDHNLTQCTRTSERLAFARVAVVAITTLAATLGVMACPRNAAPGTRQNLSGKTPELRA